MPQPLVLLWLDPAATILRAGDTLPSSARPPGDRTLMIRPPLQLLVNNNPSLLSGFSPDQSPR